MNAQQPSDVALLVSPRTRHLLDQVRWFNRLRFGAVGGMLVFIVVGSMVGILPESGPLYLLAALTAVLNLAYALWLKTRPKLRFKTLRKHVDLQIGLDLLVLSALLHFSGGVANPFVLFFLFHTLLAAQLHSVKAGLWVGALSLVMVAGLGLLELEGVLVPARTGLRLMDLDQMRELDLAVWLLAFGLTLGVSIYFLSTVLRQVRSRDEELRRLNQQLGQSEKLASIGTLAAGVANEINNPVGVIHNKAQILRYRIRDGEERDALLAELDTIEKHTKRVGAITQGLLTFSKETPFALKPLDLNALVREGLELVRVPFKDAEVILEADLAPEPVMVHGSSNHLLQVLVNILINARDASRPGDKVVIGTTESDGQACVSIRDQGVGIEDADLPKIFDPFFSTKDVDRGTGLGLAISHGIV
ncbi:MAG: sensor histidine kinase, partial [Planctomycetota bacterium]